MRAGKLKHKISIQQNTPTAAADGSREESWSDFATDVWADIRTEGGREFFRQRQLHSELSHEVIIRYLSGVKPKMRISWGSRVLEIVSVIYDEDKHKQVRLNCRETNG